MANKVTKLSLRKVSNRKIARNIIRNRIGSNKIQSSWWESQIKKYGYVLAGILRRLGKGSCRSKVCNSVNG
jgi:hypothetical protein